MDPKLRIVTQLPLRGLWRDSGTVEAARVRTLSSSDVRALLREGEVQFVVVDVGLKPRWIDLKDCYRFWMDEAKLHVADPETPMVLSQMTDGYCYKASEWQSEAIAAPIVVLEMCN